MIGWISLGHFGQALPAATLYWDGDGSSVGNVSDGTNLGGSGNWDTTQLNWWNLTADTAWPNTNGDEAIFTGDFVAGAPTLRTVALASGVVASKLTFIRSGYVLSGGDLTLAGVSPTLEANLDEEATIDSLIQGTDGLTKTGGGTVRLTNAANIYTGVTTISNGILSIRDNGALGVDGSAIVITGSATRGFGGGALMLAGGYSSGVTLERDVSLQGLGPVPASGSALLSIGDNTITGTLTNGSGALNTGISSAGGRLTLTDVTLAGTTGTTFLTVGVGGGLANAPGVGSYEITGVLSGPGSIQKSGGGTLIVSPTDAAGFSGTFRIYSGSMRFESLSAIGSNAGTGTLSTFDLAGDGAVLELRMDDAPIGKNVYMRGGGSPIITVDHAIGSGALNGTAAFGVLTYDDGETLTFNGRNGYNVTFGTTPVITGDGNTAFANNLNGLLTFTGDFWSNANNTGNRTMTISGNGNTLIDGSIIATASTFGHQLVKTGTGTLTITGSASTYTGNTSVTGTLSVMNLGGINKDSATGSILLGTTTSTGAFQYTGAADTLAKPFSLMGTTAGGAILADGTGALTLTGQVGAGGVGIKTLFLGGSNTDENTFSGLLLDNTSTNTTGLMKIGSGTWVLQEPAPIISSVSSVTIAAPGTTATTTLTLSSGNTAGLEVGQTITFSGGTYQITGIIDNTHFSISTAVATAAAPAGTYVVNPVPAASTATMGGMWSGPLTVANGTLKLTASNALSNIVQNSNPVVFNVDTYTVNQAAGGTLEFVGVSGLATTETLGALTPTAGMNIVRLTSGGAGGAASLVFNSLVAVGKGSGVNFVTAGGGGGTVTINGVATTTATTLPGNGHLYIDGANFARSNAGVIVAPVYGMDPGFVTSTTALTTGAHNEITGSFTTGGAVSITSLKIAGSQTLTLAGNLTVNTGAVANDGGILQTGGSAIITSDSATARLITTGGAGAVVIRVDGETDMLTLAETAIIGSTTTGGLTKNGQGTLVIAGVNAQTGVTTINEGTVQLSGNGRLSAASQQLDLRQGATLDLNGLATGIAINAFNGAGVVTNSNTGAATFNWGNSTTGNGVFSGIIQDGAGVVNVTKGGTTSAGTFSGLNTYTGATTIGGTAGLMSVTTLADIGLPSGIGRGNATDDTTNAASLVFAATTGGLNYTGTISVSTNRLFTLNGSAANSGAQIANASSNNSALIFSNMGAVVFGPNATVAQTLTLGGASTADNRLNLLIPDNGSLATKVTKTGSGVWVLGNMGNSYTGPTMISDGVLVAQDGTSLPAGSGLILGGTSGSAVFQSTGEFTRNVDFSTSAGPNIVSWNSTLTTGGAGFAASEGKLVVSLGGLTTPTALTWSNGGFMGTGTGPLLLSSTTALGEVEFRNAIDLNGLVRAITVNDNTSTFTDFATLTGVISGSGGISKGGAGLLQLLGANTYTGTTAVIAGQLVVTSLGSSATPGPSSLGNSTSANTQASALTLGNGSTTAGILHYVGTGETSDRMIRLNTTTGSTQILADGSGALILTNVLNDMAAGAKSLYLRGGNTQGNMITSDLANNGGNLSIVVDQAATWILGGNNTYSGNTTVSAGALGAASDTAFGTGTLLPRNGVLFAYGGDRTISNAVSVASTTTAGTFTFIGDYNIRMTGNWSYTNTTAGHTITNGMAPGKTLTLDGDMVLNALTGNVNLAINGTGDTVLNGDITTTTAFNVNISYTGNGTLTLASVNPTAGTTTLNNVNGTIRVIGGGKLGAGPLTVNAGSLFIEGSDQSVTTLTLGNVANTNATINVAAGLTLSATAVTFAGTTTLPATITGGGTLALGTSGITVTVADNATQAADMLWTIANLTGSGVFTKAGAGTLDISGVATNNFTGAYQVNAGAIKGLEALTNNLALNGGVYQSSGLFDRGLGTGSNQVQWLALGGGFAAAGGDLTVALAGAPATLVWAGTPNFVPNAAPLVFGSTSADSVTDFTHNIDLNGATRTITAVDNTAVTTDWAVLSGVVSNGAITKTGNGILRLGGANTFAGAITVSSGTLQFSTASNNGGGPSNLGQGTDGITLSGGRLQFIGSTDQTTNRAMTFTTTGILDASGVGGASITFAGAINAGSNSLNLEGSGDGVLNGLVTTTGTSADLNKNGTGTWTLNVAPIIGDNLVISGGTLIFNAPNSFDGDDLFIRAATLKLGMDGALTSAMDDFNISTETAGGGIFDINGTTGSSTTDIIIGTNPANQGTTVAFTGSMVDSIGGGSFSTVTMNVRNGLVSANVITTGSVTLGNVISADDGGTNTTSATIAGALMLNAGSSLTLINGTISGDITFGAGIATAKQSANTVVLSGNNTVAGAGTTTINGGVLVLDHSTNTGAKISNGALTMNGGTLQIDGNASTAVTVTTGNMTLGTATDPGPAAVRINTTGADAALNVGTITRNAGATLRFNPSSSSAHFLTAASNTAGDLLGGWAIYQMDGGAAQFATISSGEIAGLSSTVTNDVAAWSAGANVTDSTGFSGLVAPGMSINSLRFDSSNASTITIGSGGVLDIASGGLLITSNVSAGNAAITGGRITAGTLNELIVTHDGAATFTLDSRMAASLALTKAGSGRMVLNQDANTATGAVRLTGGILELRGGGAIGDRAPVIMEPGVGVLLDVVDSESIGSLSGGDASNFRSMDIHIGAGKALTVNQNSNLAFYGHISATSGAATFNKTGAGTLTINDGQINLGSGGVINVNQGRLAVDVNGSNQFVQSVVADTTVNIGAGASFYIDHNDVTSAAGVVGGRIADNVVFNLNSTGSTTDGLYFRNDENLAITEVIGAVNFGSGVNSVRVDSSTTTANTSQNITLRASSITRSNQATLVLHGIGIQAQGNPRAQFQNAAVMGGFGSGTGASLPVIPWAIGPSAGGAGLADSFLTTTGAANAAWRPLDLATEYAIVTDVTTWDSTASTQNVLVNTTITAATGHTIRSLLIARDSDPVDLIGSGLLTVDSGGFLFSGSTGSSTLGGFSGIQASPFVNEYVFHVVGGSATVSSPLSTATAKLTKSGAGTLVLTADNTGLGDVALNEGTVEISDLDNIGGDTGSIIFAGGTLRLDALAYLGDDLSSRTFTLLTGGGTVDTNGNTITFYNSIGTGSSGSFTKAGEGVLNLAAQVGYTGSTIVSGGTLVYGVQDALPATMNVTLAGGTLDISAYSATLAGLSITANSTLAGSAPLTFVGDVQVDGTAARTLTVNNAGLTTFSGGTIYLVNTGTTARTTTLNGTGDILISSNITNGTAVGGLTYSGSATLTLSGENSYTGTTTLNTATGTLVYAGASQLSGLALTVNAGTVILNPALDQTVGNLTLGGGAAGTTSTLMIGAGRTLTLGGTVTYSSSNSPLVATIDGGVGAILDFGGVAGTFTVGDSANAEPDMIIGANVTLQNDGGGGLIKLGTGTLHIAGTNHLTGPILIQAGAVTGDLGTGNLTLNNGVFEGNGTFSRSLGTGGGQVQWFAGASGGFAASGGALSVTLAGAPDPLVWDGTPFFVSGAGALLFGSTTADNVVTFTHDLDLNNTASPVTRTITVNDNVDVTTDKAVLSGMLGSSGAGAVTLAKAGAGVLELTGANTFSALTVTAGTLQFKTVTDNGTGPSNLGQGTDGITLTGGTLSFIGDGVAGSQATNRAITLTASSTLNAGGTNGAAITYSGPISAGGQQLQLTGSPSSAGFITGGVTHTSTSPDLLVSSGNWTISGTPLVIGDEVKVNGVGTVLNLDTTGVLSYFSGTSNFIYIGNGGTVNLHDHDVSSATLGLEGILVGYETAGAATTFNLNGFNITTPRLDVGQPGAGLEGNVIGSGTLTVTVTTAGGGLTLYRGSVSANLAGPGALLKGGMGDVILSGDNSGLSGSIRLDAGNLILDYTTSNTVKLNSGTALDMRGVTLTINGSDSAATVQTMASSTLGGGGSNKIVVNNGTGQEALLNLGAIGRANGSQDGTIRFVLPSGVQSATNGITTATLNGTHGLLGSSGFATVKDSSGTWFATNATNLAGGNIIGLVSTMRNDVTTWLKGDHITDGTTGFTGSLERADINSLRFDAAGGSALNLAAGGLLHVASGGILVTDNVASGAPGIFGGTLISGTTEVMVTQDSAQVFEISSAIRLNHAVTKTGAGTLRLSGNNVYTDETEIQEGTLQVSGGNAIGDTSLVTLADDHYSSLQLLADESIGRLAGGSATDGLRDLATVNVDIHTLTMAQNAASTYSGQLQGFGTIVKNGALFDLTLNNISTGFSGTLRINGGGVILSGVGQLDASIIEINKGAYLRLVDSSTTRSGTRLRDDVAITLNSADGGIAGNLLPRGFYINTDQDSTLDETVGVVTLGSGASYVTLEATTANDDSDIIMNNLLRTNNATLNVRGTNLGTTSSQNNQFRIGNAANQTAFIATLVGGGGGAGSQNISIVPWAIGETLTGALAATNMGNSLVTYVSGAGFRPLDFASEYDTYTSAAATDNVRESLTSDLTGLAGKTVNALVIHNDSVSGNSLINVSGSGAGQTLTNTSGAFLFTLNPSGAESSGNSIVLGGFDGGIQVGAVGEYVFQVVTPAALATTPTLDVTINSALTSNADITKSGRGTLILTTTNTAGGGANKTSINEGILEISSLANIGGSTGGLVFAGGTLRLSSSFAGGDLSTRAITFLQGGGTLDSNGFDLVFASSLGSGPGGITKIGAGTLTLNAAASYTGSTDILGGAVVLGADNAIGSGNLTVNGTALDVGTHDVTVGLVTVTGTGASIAGSGVVTSTGGFALQEGTVGAALAGAVGITKTTAATVTLAGGSTFTGPVEVQAGTLSFNSIANVGGGASALGAPTTAEGGMIYMGLTSTATTLNYTGTGHTSDRVVAMQGTTGGVTLDADGTGALVLGGAVGLTAGSKTLTLQGGSAAAVNNGIGVIDNFIGTLAVLKTEANTWEMNGSNTYTGATTINNGILRLNAVQDMAGALNFGSASNITTAGTLDVRADAAFASLTVQTNSDTNTNHLVIAAGKTLTINGNISIGSGVGALSTTLFDATGGGSLVVINDAASGTFRVGGTAGNGNVTRADLSGLDTLSVSLDTTGGIFRVNATTGTNVSNTYASLVLADNTSITAATLAVGDGGQYNGSAGQINQLLLGTGSTTFHVNTLNIGTGSRDLGSLTFLDTAGTLTMRAADGVGAVVFGMGSGTSGTAAPLPAGNRNTFDVSGHNADLLFGAMSIGTQNGRTGPMETLFAFDTGTLVGGNLVMGSKTATGNSTNVMNLGGGTVTIGSGSGTAATLASNTNTGAVSSTINVTGGTVTFGAGSGMALNLGANNTNASGSATGALNVSGGSVNLATTGATAVTLATGSTGTVTGTIAITGGTVTVQGDIIRGAGTATRNATVVLDGGTLGMTGRSIGAAGNEVAFSARAGTLSGLGELNGGAVLDKTTTGILVLGNGNTYSGGTTISAGTLQAMNTTGSATGSGAVTVLTTGTLGGTGAVAGNVQVNAGAVLSPGAGGAGQITLGGGLNIDAGGVLLLELGGALVNDASAVAAEMNAHGNLSGLTIQGTYENYQAGVTPHDSINVTGGSVPVINGSVQFGAMLNGYVPQYGDIFDLLDWQAVGGISGTTTFDFSAITLSPGLGFNTDLFASNGILVVVPEPSRVLLLVFGLLPLFSRRRR